MKLLKVLVLVFVASLNLSCQRSEFGGSAPMGIPKIRIEDWRLKVFYHSEKLCELSFEDLTKLPSSTLYTCLVRYEDKTGTCGTFEGVKIEDVLKLCKTDKNYERVVFVGADGYDTSLDASEINDSWIIAFKVNGRALAKDEGYPARVVISGRYDYKWTRWLEKIVLIRGEHYGYWELLGRDNSGVVPKYIFKRVEKNTKAKGRL